MQCKQLINTFLLLLCCLAVANSFGQQTKKEVKQSSPDLAILSFVKKQEILLRWAPGKFDLWKNANQYGYKIERFVQTPGKSDMDTSGQKLLLTTVPLKPWPQADERWKQLILKNKKAILLYNLLYKTDTEKNSANKKIVFGMVLKSCDLYPEIAMAAGSFIKDSAIITGENYVYVLSLWNVPKNFKYGAAMLTVNSKSLSELSKIKPIRVKFGDKRASISLVTGRTEDNYSGFWIERSSDSINFMAVNHSPLIYTTTKYDEGKTESIYPDSLPENDKKFYYRVRGISYFGELSPPSDIVSGKGKIDFIEYPFIDSTLIIKNKAVKLKFRMPEKYDLSGLKGFFIVRSETKSGIYKILTTSLLPKASLEFTDIKPVEKNYYKIGAINVNNDSTFSLVTYAKLLDETPPAVPCCVTGKIDTSGAVTLTWEPNKESDLSGYRVFRCNHEKEQPVELTTRILTEAKFTDKITLHTLTREIFYTVRAVDKVHNNSGYSDLCKIVKPDKIAPIPPQFDQAVHSDSAIKLSWQLSTSDDVVLYRLLKVDQSENGWKIIQEWKAKDSLKNYTDTAIEIESRYKYRLEVYDEAKNTSFTNSSFIFFRPAFAPTIKIFNASADLEKRNILLNWNYRTTNVYSYTIYKAKGDEPMRLYKTISGDQSSYVDTELYPNNIYRYTIKATLNSGVESKIAQAVEVNF